MTINLKDITPQKLIAYVALVMAILTSAPSSGLSGIHLSTVGSMLLGAFGILLHPDTSITTGSSSSVPPPA